MADNDPIRIGRTNNIESSGNGTGTILGRAANSPRTDPVFTVRTPVGGDSIHGEASGNRTGVQGTSASGIGVHGESPSGGFAGVFGESTSGAGVRGNSNSSVGVIGNSISDTGVFGGGFIGVSGNSASGIGVSGLSTSGFGMFGRSTSSVGAGGQSSSNTGVQGVSDSGLGVGGFSSSGTGVAGTSTTGLGMLGTSNGSGTGVRGTSTRGHGVVGITSGSDAYGVAGESPSFMGVSGQSSSGFGVRGISETNDGVVGRSTRGTGVVGISSSSFGGDFRGPANTPGAGSLRLTGNVVKSGGEYSEALPHPDGSQRLLYAPLSPESWYEDFGRGELVEGRGRVEFDPDFAAILGIDDGHYHVFLTPEGDSNGLYVSSRSPTAFEVHEQQGGTNSVTFSYRVVAKRKDSQPERLAKLEEPERVDFARQEDEGLQQMMRQLPPQPQPPPPSMILPSFDFGRLEEEHRGQIDELRRLVEEHRGQIDELRRLVEEQRREIEELRRRVGPQEEAPPEST